MWTWREKGKANKKPPHLVLLMIASWKEWTLTQPVSCVTETYWSVAFKWKPGPIRGLGVWEGWSLVSELLKESSLIVLDKIIHRTFRQILSERKIWGYARILWCSWYLVSCICCFPELMMNSIYSYFQLSFVSSAIGFHSNLWDKTSVKIV